MEETTTGAAPQDGAEVTAQPVEGAQPTAAQPQEPQTQSQPPAQADDTAAWLQSKGVDPNDPEAFQKVAQMAYHSEKQMTKATQEASDLKKSLAPPTPQPDENGNDPVMQEFIQDYKRDKLINGFKETHQDWNQHEPAMVEILNQVGPSGYTNSQLVNAGVLSLEMVYAAAKAAAPVDTKKIETQAQQEVLQTLANTQRAGGGNAHASNPNAKQPAGNSVQDLEDRLSNYTF